MPLAISWTHLLAVTLHTPGREGGGVVAWGGKTVWGTCSQADQFIHHPHEVAFVMGFKE